jgi:hypothetical protein
MDCRTIPLKLGKGVSALLWRGSKQGHLYIDWDDFLDVGSDISPRYVSPPSMINWDESKAVSLLNCRSCMEENAWNKIWH